MTETKSIVNETTSGNHLGSGIFDDTDDFELQQRVENVEREILELTFENTIFEIVVERKKSEPIIQHVSSTGPPVSSSQTSTPTDSNQDSTSNGTTSRADRLARKRSKSRSTQGDIRIQLTLEEKLDMIVSEYEQTMNEKTRRETAIEKQTDQLQSDLEWIDIEIADFDLAITDFLKSKDASIDKRRHKLIGEKISRYFIERLKARQSLTNKLRDRISGIKAQIVRLESQLRQNEEMGDTLNEVDFDQLKIENKQYLDKIDEKNVELILCKQQVGTVTRIINYYKDNLQTKTNDLFDIQLRIEKQQSLYEHSEQEMITASREQSRAVKKHYHLFEQTQNYQVPEILDYVRKKALLYNLQRECEVWQRKVELVSMALKQSKQQWQLLQRTTIRYHNDTSN